MLEKHEHIRGYETPDLYPSAVLVSPTFTYSFTKCGRRSLCRLEKGYFIFFLQGYG